MKYRIIDDLTSDVMFEAYGKDLKEVFINAAEAMFSVICQKDKVSAERAIEISLNAGSIEELILDWLQELIAAVCQNRPRRIVAVVDHFNEIRQTNLPGILDRSIVDDRTGLDQSSTHS